MVRQSHKKIHCRASIKRDVIGQNKHNLVPAQVRLIVIKGQLRCNDSNHSSIAKLRVNENDFLLDECRYNNKLEVLLSQKPRTRPSEYFVISEDF